MLSEGLAQKKDEENLLEKEIIKINQGLKISKKIHK